jgi:hypothetical protein
MRGICGTRISTPVGVRWRVPERSSTITYISNKSDAARPCRYCIQFQMK